MSLKQPYIEQHKSLGIYVLGTYNHNHTFFWKKILENLEEPLLRSCICKYYIFYINMLYCYEKHLTLLKWNQKLKNSFMWYEKRDFWEKKFQEKHIKLY